MRDESRRAASQPFIPIVFAIDQRSVASRPPYGDDGEDDTLSLSTRWKKRKHDRRRRAETKRSGKEDLRLARIV